MVMKLKAKYLAFVSVQLDKEGNVRSYPAPSDLAVSIKNGPPTLILGDWYLDNGEHPCGSVFTDYLRSDWALLSSAPSLAELRSRIKAGAVVEECYDCSMNFPQGKVEMDSLRLWIKNGELNLRCKS